MDPFQVEIISQRLIRDVYSEGAQIHMCAVAAIEIACWDIIGKACNQPIYNLWGGRCHEKTARLCQRLVPRSAHSGEFPRRRRAWPRAATRRSSSILSAIPGATCPATISISGWTSSAQYAMPWDSVDLLIEGHCRFNVATAVEFAEAIHQFRPAWFEEPVPHTNINAMVEVARRSPVPIATGESLSTKQQFAELLQHDVVSILQPEPLNVGGLFADAQDRDMIDAHFGVVAPHSAQGPVCSAACVQLNASMPNFFIHEIFDEFNEPWEKEIVTNAVEVVDGYIEVPDGRDSEST